MRLYAVEIYKKETGEVMSHMDGNGEGMPLRMAEKIQRGASFNLNHADYAVRIVEVTQPNDGS